MTIATVADIVAALEVRFPRVRAAEWDRVGLLVGDPAQVVDSVLVGLDPTREAVELAVRRGAQVLVTHHPAFLGTLSSLTPSGPPQDVAFLAASRGVALVSAHTNLDRDESAQRLLPDLLGVEDVSVLEDEPVPMSVVTTFAPAEAIPALEHALADAGAGRVGDYTGCRFTVSGVGAYRAPEGSSPLVGEPGETTVVDEVRLETVCARNAVTSVIAAVRVAHPYEEPLITACECVTARNRAALGAVGTLGDSISLAALAERAHEVFGSTSRVWGDADRAVTRVATSTGSGRSLIDSVLRARADVFVTGELGYHDSLRALSSGLAVLELGHDVSEWPMVDILCDIVASVPGIEDHMIHRIGADPAWWTTRGS